MMKIDCNVYNKCRKLKNSKISCIFLNIINFLFAVSVVMNIKKYLKKNNQLKY